MTELQQPAGLTQSEQSFLYGCLRGRWDSEALQRLGGLVRESAFNWERVLHRIEQELLGPLIYRAIRDQAIVPPQIEQRLSQLYYQTACQNTLLFGSLVQVLRSLNDRQIPVLILKGAALAQVVYGDVALRPMSDLDLLIRPADLPQVRQCLQALGYTAHNLEIQEGYTDEFRNEAFFFKDGLTRVGIDLHWKLVSLTYYQRVLSSEWFWETALPIEFDRTPTSILGYEAQLLHLCAHLFWHHQGEGMLWQHDIAEFLMLYQDKIDWIEVLKQAQRFRLVLPLQQVLPEIMGHWQVTLPPGILEEIRLLQPSPEEQTLFAWLNARYLRTTLRYFLADLTGLSGWQQKSRFLWNTVFPSSRYMQQRYRIEHPALLPFYYLYRLCRGVEVKR